MVFNRNRGVITGILFLTAMVSSLVGGGILGSVLGIPDFLTKVSANIGLITSGVILELINAVAVIGIAVTMFPLIKRHNESLALGYVGFRIIESLLCTLSAVIPLLLLSLGLGYQKSAASELPYIHAINTLLLTIRLNLAEIFIPLFFGLGALVFYYLLYSMKLIPAFISIWGFIAAVLILILIVINGGTVINMVLVLPVILNEIFLGIWLIVRGFREVTSTTGSA